MRINDPEQCCSAGNKEQRLCLSRATRLFPEAVESEPAASCRRQPDLRSHAFDNLLQDIISANTPSAAAKRGRWVW